MDDLEFRRRLYAAPLTHDADIKEAVKNDPAKKRFHEELSQFENKLENAMNVEVPDNLVSKIIFQQTSRIGDKKTKSKTGFQFALVASIAFAFGIMVPHLSEHFEPGSDFAQQALAHHYVDMSHHPEPSKDISLADVNFKLAAYGAELEQIPGDIYSVNYCQIEQTRALHLIYQTDAGPVSLLFVPKRTQQSNFKTLHDDNYQVQGVNYRTADILYILPKDSDFARVKKNIDKKLHWKI